MKKQVLITILFAMLMSMPMFAYDFQKDGIYYNIEGDHVAVTYSGKGVYQGKVYIPYQVTFGGVTYPVTAIGEWAFEGGEDMTYLSIPSSITTIGEYAFVDCGSNIEVSIADLTAWCKVQFGNEHSSPLSSAKRFYLNNSEVKQLVIPDGVESIPNYAFYQCRSITSLNIAGSVKSIGSSAFEDCTGLTSIYVFDGVESIGGSSFEGCTGLSTIIFPSTLSSIALNAFKNCSNLNTIVSRIQEPFAFVDNVFCTYSTATVIVPEGTMTVYQLTDGWNLFDNITDDSSQDPTKRTIHVATAGTLPNLISADEKYQIEELALTGELNGTDFKLIRDMAGVSFYFKNYQGAYYPETNGILWSLDLSNADIVNGGEGYVIADEGSPYYNKTRTISPEDYNYKYTKSDCISTLLFFKTKLKSIILPQNVTTIEDGAFKDCSVLTSIEIPNNATSIGWCAFEGCKALTYITIPDDVNSIEANAFQYCSGLTSITVESGNQYYDSRNNCNAIIEKSTNTLIIGCKNSIIPNSVTSIGSSAFRYCSGLTSITIPNSVTSISDYTFQLCSGLTSVTIPNSVMSIGSSAFEGCSGLTSITIGNSVTSIGSSTFYNCSSLTYVTIPNSVTSIGSSAFYNCSSLTSVSIPNSVISLGGGAFYGTAWYNNQPDGLVYAGKVAYKYKGEMPANTNINIEDGTLGIAGSAFWCCSGLTSVTIPNSVTSIGRDAFYGCSGLTSITIPNSVTSIDYYVFRGCSGLTSVTIPNSVTSIGSGAFYYCDGLTSITIPNSVTSIGDYAFSYCRSLTTVVSKIENPFEIPFETGKGVFDSYPNDIYTKATLYVPGGKESAYRATKGWKKFTNIREFDDGDVNLDEKVNRNDQNALVAHIMGEKPEGFYEGLADLNGDDDVNAADVVTLIDVIGSKGLSTEAEFGYDNIDGSLVVSSLTCTLNNERDEAILLTRCELYSNGSLLRSKSFANNPVSIAAGGNKSCTFENLSKPANSTDFTVSWHYTVNGESFVYRCPLTD